MGAFKMYLWCSQCECVYLKRKWTLNGTLKNGQCPNVSCGAREHNNAMEWKSYALANGYDEDPVEGRYYPAMKLF